MTARHSVTRLVLLTCTTLGWLAMVAPARAQDDVPDIPTGAPRSPLLNGATPFSQKLMMYEEIGTRTLGESGPDATLPVPAACTGSPASAALDTFLKTPLWPAPREKANDSDKNPWLAKINECLRPQEPFTKSPMEGRPPGDYFAHQRYSEFKPEAYVQTVTAGARTNTGLRDSEQRHRFAAGTEFGPGGLYYNPLTGPTTKGIDVRLHPKLPIQNPSSVWTFDGTFPAKLIIARYGEPLLLRHYNALPIGGNANNGFGINQLSTHLHNGHNPGESDGYPGAYFYPGQYYDYRYPLVLSGHDRVNTDKSSWRTTTPEGLGDRRTAGDFHETLSTLWFHDHRIDHTSENVYKGMAGMMNVYSGIDRGREGHNCKHTNPEIYHNLCLPSGTYLGWGNRDYDVNLSIADKAWDASGQLYFNIFTRDGFLGDRMTVNWTWQPYLDVRPRRYRFRMLNASMARFLRIALVTAAGKRVPFHMVANDGNIMEHAVPFPNAESQDMPLQAIGERFDIVVDFKAFAPGTRLYFVNLAEHEDGSRAKQYATLDEALRGKSSDPAVGKFLEFRVAAPVSGALDLSMNPADYVEGKLKMIERAKFTAEELANARVRNFYFGHSGGTDDKPWTIRTDNGRAELVDLKRSLALPKRGSVEIWNLINNSEDGDGGWAHPVHIHFEEGQILSRNGMPPPIWEKWARKDMYNIGRLASHDVKVAIRFEDFLGSYVEHCHNTTHEDYAMMLRFDVANPDEPMLIKAPLPSWEGVEESPSYAFSE